MGYKIKTLGPAFRSFTANLAPIQLTAGVPISELYFGLYGRIVLAAAAGGDGTVLLNQIDEIKLTRGGQSFIEIENGQDLWALTKFPWLAQAPDVTTGGSSGHYQYWKGLNLPLSLPPGAAGEYMLQVDNAGSASTSGEEISIAEGWGRYAANYFGQGPRLLNTGTNSGKHFHIVKRLKTPSGTGWGDNFYIGTEGDLVGLLIYSTTEQGQATAKTALSIEELRLDIGGESVIEASSLTVHGTQGPSQGSQSDTGFSFPTAVLGEYIAIDFRRQPWNCRGKSVNLRWDAGTADAVRAYPIYLVDW
jgi:hypothetical protein